MVVGDGLGRAYAHKTLAHQQRSDDDNARITAARPVDRLGVEKTFAAGRSETHKLYYGTSLIS